METQTDVVTESVIVIQQNYILITIILITVAGFVVIKKDKIKSGFKKNKFR